VSAGLLMYRKAARLEVLLVHPGGPFFAKKDLGAWTIPKGVPASSEPLLAAAIREFREETGLAPHAPYLELGSIRQKGGKLVHGWAFEGELPQGFVLASNSFELEWPPRSGQRRAFPEIDRAELFELARAHEKINPAQRAFLERLAQALATQA
jgi:predicted NUDIX family NTP pyrophosphohydrolase